MGSLVLSPNGNDPSSLVGPWYVKALIINATPKVPVPVNRNPADILY